MKLYEGATLILIIILGACIICGTISGYFWYHENVIEEIAEEIIKEKTGMDIDLTPSSPEPELLS